MQKAYITTLYELASADKRVISVLSDSGTEYDELFARDLPDQLLNVGIAEENQVGIAAGLAKAGKIPFVYTSGAFLAYRAFEFIRDDVCLQGRNVKIVGMGSGISWSTLGPTHHTTEDLAVLRCLPGLRILSPATPLEASAAIRVAYELEGPVYIKLGMGGEPELHDDLSSFDITKPIVYRDGSDATVFVSGPIASQAIDAARLLEERGLSIGVVGISYVKPSDELAILEIIQKNRSLLTVEEHNITGGVGSMIAEVIADYGLGCKITRIGLVDKFAIGYGSYDQVRQANGLDSESIANTIAEAICA